ncbi:MAG: hypothetical protein DRH51_08570 [Candidatus Coatesbacteria bacterium]|nr:MAG: hypothetical protein DRH51_08570 [Candidatus Coatesbacteria bacterium]
MSNKKAYFISDDKLNGFIESLNERVPVYVPQRFDRADGTGIYTEYRPYGEGEVDLESRTLLSVKSIFLPQCEVILGFTTNEERVDVVSEAPSDERVLFSIRNCDFEAVRRLDLLFGWDYRDEFWFARRENTIIVVNLCDSPLDDKCFCHWVGVDPVATELADCAMLRAEGGYIIWRISERGDVIIDVLDKVGADEVDVPEVEAKGFDNAIEVDGSHNALFEIFTDEIWKVLEPSCIGCGICTFVCPTCHCFEIQDEGSKRVRFWDYCTGYEFTRTEAHQPRPRQYQRYRQRVMHKYSYYPRRFGVVGCTGCGRCISACPQNVDIREDIVRLLKRAKVIK